MSDKIIVQPSVINDVEFYVTPDGKDAGVSISGLARLCGVDRSTIREVINNLSDAGGKTVPESLEPLRDKTFNLGVEGVNGAKIVTSIAVTMFVEYYSYESKAANVTARNTYRKLAQYGFVNWVKDLTGAVVNDDNEAILNSLKLLSDKVDELSNITTEYKQLRNATVTNFPNLDLMLNELTVTTELTTHNGYVTLSDYIKSKGFVADKSTMHRFANLVADTYKTTTGNNPTKINVKLGKNRYKPNTSAYEVEMIPMLDMCFRKLVNS
jgi:hypothetical protein